MKSFFTGNKIKILLHILAWIIILGIPLYFFKRWEVGKDFMWVYYIGNIINGIIFYTNYLILVPKYFFKSQKHNYYLSVVFLLTFLYFVSDRSNELVFKYVPGRDNVTEVSKQNSDQKEPPGPKPDDLRGRPPFREMHLFNFIFTSLFLVFF